MNYLINKRILPILVTLLFLPPTLLHSQSARPLVSNINAQGSSRTKITVTWTLPKKTEGNVITELLIYKATRPLIDISSFANLNPIARIPGTSVTYTDTVKDTNEYYYAVISVIKAGSYSTDMELYYDEDIDGPLEKADALSQSSTYKVLLPGVNATVKGAKVKITSQKERQKAVPQVKKSEKSYTENELREKPLPFMDILGDNAEVHEHKISTETESYALSLVKGSSYTQTMLESHVFEDDILSPAGGDEYFLFEILKNSFIQKKYAQSEKELKDFLSQNRKQNVTNRANFYLGESYYFQGKYSNALSQFLLVEETYPSLTKKWIESTLDLYQMQ